MNADPNQEKQAVIVSPYDAIAEWYDEWVGTHSMREDAFFLGCEMQI